MQSQKSALLKFCEKSRAEDVWVVHESLVSLNVRRRVVAIMSDQHIGPLHAREDGLHEPGKEIRIDEEYGASGG